MKRSTLSRKLFFRIVPTIVLAISVIGGSAFYSADKEINDVYDAQLISNANVLWTLISDELKEKENGAAPQINYTDLTIGNQLALNDSVDDYANSRMFRIWKTDHIVMCSDTAFPENIAQAKKSFSYIKYNGDKWRVYALKIADSNVTIEVGEKTDLRNTLVANILLNLALPLMLLVPLVGVMIWFGIDSGLGVIRNMVLQIRKRSPDDLSHIDADSLPAELAPLAKSLNQLLTKLEHSFTAEKRFTDHAAHQLRTPQATIKLQLQMLARTTDKKERDAIVKELMLSNERSIKLVDMLLTSARLSHQHVDVHIMDAYRAVASVMADLGAIAREKNITMSLDGDENANALADEQLFRLMMENIIENAIKYTTEGGSVNVLVANNKYECLIAVEDNGCGIPESERKLVFERFYRVSTPEAEGSGLGLAIVAEIVERLSGNIELKQAKSGQGLLVEVKLPAQ